MKLLWIEKDGIENAEAFGASYQVWEDASTETRLVFWAIVFGGFRREGLAEDKNKAKYKCQSHQDAICGSEEDLSSEITIYLDLEKNKRCGKPHLMSDAFIRDKEVFFFFMDVWIGILIGFWCAGWTWWAWWNW